MGYARLIDAEGRIERLVNNYMYISFNFGPTLLSWMEEKAPETYAAILAADAESRRRYAGHGSALAQAYNHMILPLRRKTFPFQQLLNRPDADQAGRKLACAPCRCLGIT